MTENPTPGAAPENRNPGRHDAPEQPEARDGNNAEPSTEPTLTDPTLTDPTPGTAADNGPKLQDTAMRSNGNQPHDDLPAGQDRRSDSTERLDRPQDGWNSTQPLASAPQPQYPPRQPFYGQQNPGQEKPGQPNYGQHSQGGQNTGQQPYVQQHAGQYHAGQQYAQHAAHSAGPGGFAGGPGGIASASNPANAPRRKASFGVGTLVASILAAGLVGGGVATVGSSSLFNPGSSSGVSNSSQAAPVIVNNRDDVNAITAAALKATPSVVTISASSGSAGGTGSGIILDDEGHILTNTHVVTLDGQTADAALEIRTSDGRVLSAKLVGTDPLSDLAVIKVDDASGLTAATLGDSSKLNVGDTAIAIGSPLGLTGTVTDGIVSTLNRTISVASSAAPKNGDDSQSDDEGGFQFAPPDGGQGQARPGQGSISINVIQTDAAINPGNSGGALVNTKGEIIGVNVAIASAGSSASSTSGNIGVGFSIPINHAKRVAQEIIDTGKASHGQLGVSVKDKSSSGSASGFSVGADVATVEAGSPAANAGIKVGDVVTKFNDLAISDPNQLTAAVREQAAGAKVKITILRNGQEQTLDVTLGTAAEQ
ncbi:trypsin-like peptidase domain-containing protein [Arthrobacter sp. D1-29]